MKLLILNGPNLNMLGIREPEIYGKETYEDLCRYLEEVAINLNVDIVIKQSNHEGELVDWIQESRLYFEGIILNAAAYTHTSIAILDALKAVALPTVEVHLSDIDQRESYRKHSYIREACVASVYGKGFESYKEAMVYLEGESKR